MRRGGTTLVVLVVAAIALAASFDALRGEGEPQPAAESEPEQPPRATTLDEPDEEPAVAAQPGGTLYYTDEDCKLRAIVLVPDEPPVDPPNWDECRFVLSPDARRVSGAGTGWAPRAGALAGRLFQWADGTIQVSDDEGPEGEAFAGTAPAWMPDGTLTYFADGAVREWPSGDVALSEHDMLQAAIEAVPLQSLPKAVSLRESAWLSDRRFVAIISLGPGEDLLGIYDRNRLVGWRLSDAGSFSDLRVSSRGTYLAVKAGPDEFVVLDADGEPVDTLGIVGRRGRRGLRFPAGPQRPARDRARPGRPRSRLARGARAGGHRPGGRHPRGSGFADRSRRGRPPARHPARRRRLQAARGRDPEPRVGAGAA
jgi:hypothetical protein